MNQHESRGTKHREFPHIGQRIGKTAIAVFLCLLIYRILLGYEGDAMPAEAGITAIICMQPFVRDSRAFAINRVKGTLIGVVWGLIFLWIFYAFHLEDAHFIFLYALMGVGVLFSLYSAVVVGSPDASGLAAIVFLCIVIAFPDIDAPIRSAFFRVGDVLIGTFVAIGVNVFRLPYRRNPNYLFFVRTKDLIADRYAQVAPSIMFKLNYLHEHGAKVCLISDHAPAFFTLQMSSTKLDVPLIVMDGAAVYDINSNQYLYQRPMDPASSAWLMQKCDELGAGYFIYTIHDNKTCIFHHGTISEEEQVIFQSMKRSPYRSYLEGEDFHPEEIVYIKIIATEEVLQQYMFQLYPSLEEMKLRASVRDQAGDLDVSGLYLYALDATVENAENFLTSLIGQTNPSVKPIEVFSRTGYRSEHDALLVMNEVEALFEPNIFAKREEL